MTRASREEAQLFLLFVSAPDAVNSLSSDLEKGEVGDILTRQSLDLPEGTTQCPKSAGSSLQRLTPSLPINVLPLLLGVRVLKGIRWRRVVEIRSQIEYIIKYTNT